MPVATGSIGRHEWIHRWTDSLGEIVIFVDISENDVVISDYFATELAF